MKKITIVYDFLKEVGGLERVMFFQANRLKKKYSVELLFGYVSQKKEEIAKDLSLDREIKIFQLGKGSNEILKLISYLLLPGRAKKLKSDLLLSHSFMSSRVAMKKKEFDKTPYIVMMHHPPQYLYDRDFSYVNNVPRLFAFILGVAFGDFLKKMDIKAVKKADLVLANSHYTAERIKKIYGIEPVVIYPAIASQFKIIDKGNTSKILSKLGIKEKYVLLHGRMIRDKRPDLAVNAFAKLLKKKKDLLLAISGTIEEKEKIMSLISELKIKDRVKILGRVSSEELVALYNGADCFLMSAPKEDFGLTPVEAMACGCPVVAWKDNAGPEETVKEGVNGFLAKPYDIDDFSDKINKVLNKKWDKKKVVGSVSKLSEKEIVAHLNRVISSLI